LWGSSAVGTAPGLQGALDSDGRGAAPLVTHVLVFGILSEA
jgi:hypothetical protein